MIASGSAGDIAKRQVADLMKGTPLSDIVEMLRTPTGCVPPSKWELAAAKEIERLRVALQKIANLPLEKTVTFKRKPDPIVRARRIAIAALRDHQ
jgi:hypothetical protein